MRVNFPCWESLFSNGKITENNGFTHISTVIIGISVSNIGASELHAEKININWNVRFALHVLEGFELYAVYPQMIYHAQYIAIARDGQLEVTRKANF